MFGSPQWREIGIVDIGPHLVPGQCRQPLYGFAAAYETGLQIAVGTQPVVVVDFALAVERATVFVIVIIARIGDFRP